MKIFKKEGGGICGLFKDGVEGWLYRLYSLLIPQSICLVLVFVPGAKRYSFIGAVLSRLEPSGIVNVPFFKLFSNYFYYFKYFYQAKHIKIV